ncbi:SDR family NAD(P)-dependent oxidoreductase [Amycolatopsis benzoatilytica]|uniref:SDR family NAD(P)-dependent oxidoreductase n=1 Tax=Amycolatopsis benzoatilytica TaxID=346045 RepID=UPI000362326F|nr:glucose 1-dehydrogenase [Amycolatopsis benzoatilytica]
MSTLRAENKICVITGAASGLGAAARDLLAGEGATVIGFDVAEPVSPDPLLFRVDVSDEHAVAAAVARVACEYGRIDVLVNNAGIPGPRKPAHEVTAEEFDRVFAVNVRGTWLCTKHVIPHMLTAGRGSIVNMSSMYGLVGNALIPAYHATKGAIRLMTKADAVTYAPHGIRVNSVHPGSIETHSPASVRADKTEKALAYNRRTLESIPLGRRGEPIDIAYGVLYLASDESRYLTGSELVIDGGYTAR